MSSGIRRKIDDLGRVVIPAGIRRSLGMREGDAVEVAVEGERVVLSRPREACVFCGREDEDLLGFRGRLVCHDCAGAVGDSEARERARRRAEVADAPRRPDELPDWTTPARSTGAPIAQEPTPASGPTAREGMAPATPAPPARPPAPAPPAGPAPASSHDSEPRPPDPGPAGARPDDGVAGQDAPGAAGPHGARPDDGRGADGDRPVGDPAAEDAPRRPAPRRDRPPYDPASTTAW